MWLLGTARRMVTDSNRFDASMGAINEVTKDEGNAALHPLLRAVRRVNGRQSISLVNGGFIRFTTCTGSQEKEPERHL